MFEYGIFFMKDKNRLLVFKQDHDKKIPYGFSYDANEVYCTNLGEISCMKCMGEVRFQFEREDSGTLFCMECNQSRGRFRRIGYGTYIKGV